jgi:fused signal recognition particle receptor
MFKFLKQKISEWTSKSKKSIETKAEAIEKKEAGKESKVKEPEAGKAIKKQKKEIKKQEKPLKKKDIKKETPKPGQSEDLPTKLKDPVEILSEKSPEEVAQVLEERKSELPEDTDEKLKEFKEHEVEAASDEPTTQTPEEEEEEENLPQSEKKQGFFSKLKSSLAYKITNENFQEIFEDLELLLLENNVALEAVDEIKKQLQEQLIGKEIKKQDLEYEIKLSLKKALESLIIEPDNPLEIIKQIKAQNKGPFKIAFLGINGAGKTTTMAKFAKLLQTNNLSSVFAAGDTFRAASIEQLEHHANALNIKVVKHDYNADPAAVAFDAIKYAEAHKIDVVLIDTAGRMHTKDNLLQEMEKICRVSKPDLKIFVAESIAGNDATEQAKAFNEAVEIDGAILSKADIDEKGGTIISISHITNKPIFYLGMGQNYEDLELFNKQKFIDKLELD